MKRFIHLASLSFLMVFARQPLQTIVSADEPERVAVIKDAELRVQSESVGRISAGYVVEVKQRSDNWLWVEHGGTKGWLNEEDTASPDEALKHFTKIIQREPNNPNLYSARAITWFSLQNYDAAILDTTIAMRKTQQARPDFYCFRAVLWMSKKRFRETIADANIALRLGRDAQIHRQNRANAFQIRATAYRKMGHYQLALRDYDKATQTQHNLAMAYSGRAFLLATCPDAQYRDGKKALEDAKHACQLSGNRLFHPLASLSLAEAENGNFTAAKKTLEEAKTLAPSTFTSDYLKWRKLFDEQIPFREFLPDESGSHQVAPPLPSKF